jgi:hypothetical protein
VIAVTSNDRATPQSGTPIARPATSINGSVSVVRRLPLFVLLVAALPLVAACGSSSTSSRVVQPNGPMYANLSGNRTQKVQVIYDWVVNSKAAQ